MSASQPCPCCGYLTLGELRMYELCPVCFWEDDPHQADQPDSTDGANGVSLTEGRATYRRIGAIAPEFVSKVRPPTADEMPEREERRPSS